MWYRRHSSHTVGLDIGRTSVRALVIDNAAGVPEIIGWHEERWAPIQDVQDRNGVLRNTQEDALQRTVDSVKQWVPLHRAQVVTALYGRGVIVKPVGVEPVAEHQVRELLRWETEAHLPFPTEETVFDHVVLPKTHPGELRVLLVAVHKPLVDERRVLLSRVGIKRAAITVDALALLNACRFQSPSCAVGDCVLLMRGEAHLQALLLSDGVPVAVWEQERTDLRPSTPEREAGALPMHSVCPVDGPAKTSDVWALYEAVLRSGESQPDYGMTGARSMSAPNAPVPPRGAWLCSEQELSQLFLTELGERLCCPVHTTSAFASLPIRSQNISPTESDSNAGRYMVACGLALQGAPIALSGGGERVAN